jgi:hypothetical protein
MLAYKGELLFDGYGNYGIVLQDVPYKPPICERNILVSHPEFMIGYVCDITTRGWYRQHADIDKGEHIFSENVIGPTE